MASWTYRIDLSDIWDADIPFTEKRDTIVARFRAKFPDQEHYELGDLLDSLTEAEDEDAFDDVWNEIYDWADWNRCWIGTF